MSIADRIVQLLLSGILIVGAYQFYFWCQRNPIFKPREWRSALDEAIPYRPGWVWIYSFLYYPAILYTNFAITSPRHFCYVAANFLTLLAAQMAFFLLYPVSTPESWRAYNQRRTVAERFLAVVQSFDARSNSFPSMHVSVAMLTALHLQPSLGAWAFGFPILIAVSCVFTKQHYLIDLPAGALLGWGVFQLFQFTY